MFSSRDKQTLKEAIQILLKAINSSASESNSELSPLNWETKLVDFWADGQKTGQKIMANFLTWDSYELCRDNIKSDFVIEMFKQRESGDFFKKNKPQKFSDKQMNVINKAWDELINGDDRPVKKAKAIEPTANFTTIDNIDDIPF